MEIALRERIKELNCLYGIAQLAERYSDSLEDLLKSLVDFLPLSWQYPEIACARITFEEKIYQGPGIQGHEVAPVVTNLVYNEPVGEVAVFYLEERPPADEGPFLREERALLDALAERIGTIAMRISAERELQEMNRQLTPERRPSRKQMPPSGRSWRGLKKRSRMLSQYPGQHGKDYHARSPCLGSELPKAQRKYVEMLRANLEEITSPFIGQLSRKYHALTPTEVTICNMIKTGMRTKEIAQLQGVSRPR